MARDAEQSPEITIKVGGLSITAPRHEIGDTLNQLTQSADTLELDFSASSNQGWALKMMELLIERQRVICYLMRPIGDLELSDATRAMIEGLNLIDAPQWVVLDRFTNARACDSTSEATLYTRLAEKVMRELGYQNTWEIRCAIMAISTVKILEARSAHGSRILQSHHTHS